MKFNPLAVSKLKASANATNKQAEAIYCYLEIGETKLRYDFILNPQSISMKSNAQYESLPTAGTNIPRLQYKFTEAQTLSLEGLLFLSQGNKTSIQPLLDAARNLLKCDPQNKKFSAPVLNFVWGTRRLDNCVLTSFDYKETFWSAEGFPTLADGSMTFIEVPPLTPKVAVNQGSQATTTKLTERELVSGSKEANNWLKKGQLKLGEQLNQRIKTNKFKLKTDTKEGKISITDDQGKILQTIGTNLKGKFIPIK